MRGLVFALKKEYIYIYIVFELGGRRRRECFFDLLCLLVGGDVQSGTGLAYNYGSLP